MINRWWPVTFWLSLALFVTAWGVSRLPEGKANPDLVTAVMGLGGITFIFTLFLLLIRKAAYVQAFPKYLRVVTLDLLQFLFRSCSRDNGYGENILSPGTDPAVIIDNIFDYYIVRLGLQP